MLLLLLSGERECWLMVMVVKIQWGTGSFLYTLSHRCSHICLIPSVPDSDAVLKMCKPTGAKIFRKPERMTGTVGPGRVSEMAW